MFPNTEAEQESSLEDHHLIEAPTELSMKKDSMKDLLPIFSDIVIVQFKKKDAVETVRGHWCLPCKLVQFILKENKGLLATWNRMNEKTVKAKGLRKTFLTGSNSSCRQHIHQHYDLYKQKCNDSNIPVNYRAIPPHILKEMEASKKLKKKQSTLEGVSIMVSHPTEFT